MTLAEKLKKLRTRSNMSMSQVARLSELSGNKRGRITQGYISRLESGKETNPSLQKLLTLSRIYRADPNELFSGNSKRHDPQIAREKSAYSSARRSERKMREVMESLARSPKYLDAVRSLLTTDKGRKMLNHYGSIPGGQRGKLLTQRSKAGSKIRAAIE